MPRNPLHCILPPYMVERMADSPDPKIRELALKNIASGAEARAIRATIGPMAMLAVNEAPTKKRHRLIYSMKGQPQSAFFLPGKLVRSEGDKRSKDVAVNEAYDFAGATYDFYNKVFGRNSLDGGGMTLASSVHFGAKFNNAFWNGQQMVYGDGDGKVFRRFTRSLDVVGHEMTHGVVTFTCNLEYRAETGALNEHFADVFGVLVRQWKKKLKASATKPEDWLIGADLMVTTETRRALRDMAAPGTAFNNDPHLGDDPQPAHMRQKYTGLADNEGVHINSGIPNKAFHEVAMSLGGHAWEKAGRVWYDTMLQLSPRSQFADCARISHQVAGARFGVAEQRVVKEAWKSVGIAV